MFSWDEAKNKNNQRKHGVSFETAKLIFYDLFHLAQQDRIENGEARWQTIGRVENVVLLVAHIWYVERVMEYIRIISARFTTKLERRIYEEQICITRTYT